MLFNQKASGRRILMKSHIEGGGADFHGGQHSVTSTGREHAASTVMLLLTIE